MCDLLPLSQGFTSFCLFRTFWCFAVLSIGEQKVSQSARLEVAEEDHICFLVRRLNHSAKTAWRRSYFYLFGPFFVELLCELLLPQDITQLPLFGSFRSVDEFGSVDQILLKSARFQIQLDEPIWVLVNWPQRNQLWLLIRFGKFYRCRSFHLELLCDLLFLSQGVAPFWLFRTYWWFDVLSTGERKISQSARFELAQEDPIWFWVRRLNHSAMTAWRRSYFYLSGSFFVELLCELILSQDITQLPLVGSLRSVDEFSSLDRKVSKSARFELQLDEPIWNLVKRPQRFQLWLLIRFTN